MKGFLIAGAASGVGKTTVALSLLAAMRRRQLTVQPFKAGPDFLDTGHHSRIAGRAARNLDTWMLSHRANQDLLRAASADAQVVVVEGMMGLFDGKDGASQQGSSAEVAKLFSLPVILVLDAAKTSHSIAAIVLGFERFDPELSLAGVILNRVASKRHFEMLSSSIRSSCRTPVLGWVPRDSIISIAERHLGLQTPEEQDADTTHAQIDRFAAIAEDSIDLDALLALDCGFDFSSPDVFPPEAESSADVRVAVAQDKAFSFYYQDNLDLLRAAGAEIVPFSPLTDRSIPDDIDALYLGGGYPELHAETLSSNRSMLDSVRAFASSGRPIYAECGGMIYLSRSLTAADGTRRELAKVLPFDFEITDRLVHFGYVTVELTQDCVLGAAGTLLRGHSFHYSRMVGSPSTDTCYRIHYSLSQRDAEEGFLVDNVLASYIHIHFRTSPHIARSFVGAARVAKAREGAAR